MEEKKGFGEIEFRQRKHLVFLGLPFTFTVYTIREDVITIESGFFRKVENDCYMYKVQDVEHSASFAERIFKLGTIVCYTGDTTHPKLRIEHVRMSKDIKNFILKASEKARMRKRTLNTLNIGDGSISDIDDIDEVNAE